MSVAPDTELPRRPFRSPAATVDGFVEQTVITTDGVHLAARDYQADRADAPTVVLLHGLLLSQESWAAQVRRLRGRYGSRIRIVTYDHRGHGRSASAAMTTYEIDRLADDLAEVLTALHIAGPLTLAGHSMGGMTALAYLGRPASRRPVEPRGLVLVGTAAGGLAVQGIGRLLATPATEALFGLVHRMPQRTADRTVRTLVRPFGDALDALSGVGAAVTARAVRTMSITTAAGFLPSLKRYDAYQTLEGISAKTFVVSGGADPLTPPSHSRDLAAAIPDAIHLYHPAAGHMLLQEAADCVSTAISRAMGLRGAARRSMSVRQTRRSASEAQLAVVVS